MVMLTDQDALTLCESITELQEASSPGLSLVRVNLDVNVLVERAIVVENWQGKLSLGFLPESNVVPGSIRPQVKVVGHLGPGGNLIQVDVLKSSASVKQNAVRTHRVGGKLVSIHNNSDDRPSYEWNAEVRWDLNDGVHVCGCLG